MIYFRYHRGGLEDSLKTQKKFNNMLDLFKYLDSSDYTIKYYGFDTRQNIGDTFIVISHKFDAPIGFIYLKNGGLENEKN